MVNLFIGSGNPRLYLGDRLIGGGDYDLVGTLTPNSAGAYLFPQNYDWSKPWELGTVVQKADSEVNPSGYIFAPQNGYFGAPKLNLNDSSIGLVAPKYNSSPDTDGLGIYFDTPLVRGKAYWIRAGYEGSTTNKIYIEMSEDGLVFNRLGERVISFVPIYDPSVSFGVGGEYDMINYSLFPKMAIVLNETYIKIDGAIAWGRGAPEGVTA